MNIAKELLLIVAFIKMIAMSGENGDVCSLGEQYTYRAFIADDQCVHMMYTTDGGMSWNDTTVTDMVSESGSVFVSFADEETGYILYCSDPGAGQMEKILYMTQDGGRTFSVKEDLSAALAGYPTDMLYTSEGTGYITTTYHGTDEFFYRCGEEGGWDAVEVEIPLAGCSYVNGVGIERTDQCYVLRLEAVTLDGRVSCTYTSLNGLDWTFAAG